MSLIGYEPVAREPKITLGMVRRIADHDAPDIQRLALQRCPDGVKAAPIKVGPDVGIDHGKGGLRVDVGLQKSQRIGDPASRFERLVFG